MVNWAGEILIPMASPAESESVSDRLKLAAQRPTESIDRAKLLYIGMP
jgi:hypothetical protein